MPRRRTRGARARYRADTPIPDEEIARSEAVEHIDGVGAVQPLTVGESFTLLSTGDRLHGSVWYEADGETANWSRLEGVGVLQVLESDDNRHISTRINIVGATALHNTSTSPDTYIWKYETDPTGALTDEEIAASEAVEHIDGTGAVQSLRIGQPFYLYGQGNSYDADTWYLPDGTTVDWNGLAAIGVHEVKEDPENVTDERWVTITGKATSLEAGPPAFYQWSNTVDAKDFATVLDESKERVFQQYQSYTQDNIHWHYLDTQFGREEANDPGAIMDNEARQGGIDSWIAYQQNYRVDVELANDVRDVQVAELAWDAVYATLWRFPV